VLPDGRLGDKALARRRRMLLAHRNDGVDAAAPVTPNESLLAQGPDDATFKGG
jgi:hypothetical protein